MDGAVVDIKMKNDEKNKALEAAIGQIEKAFGKGSVMNWAARVCGGRRQSLLALSDLI